MCTIVTLHFGPCTKTESAAGHKISNMKTGTTRKTLVIATVVFEIVMFFSNFSKEYYMYICSAKGLHSETKLWTYLILVFLRTGIACFCMYILCQGACTVHYCILSLSLSVLTLHKILLCKLDCLNTGPGPKGN